METVIIEESTAIAQINKSEIDMQVATAHKYPRELSLVKDEAMSMVTATPEIAESMGYALPIAGRTIMGPSIRLAEVVVCCYGNMRYGSRVIDVGEKTITAQGMCHDLQKNNLVHHEVKRNIFDKKGKRYKESLITTTCNAACAIALREAIFKVVPRSVALEIYNEAMKVARGDARSLAQRRQAAVDYFINTMGVSLERIIAVLDRGSFEEITTDDVGKLQGFKVTLKDGGKIEDIFPEAKDAEQNKKTVVIDKNPNKGEKKLAPGEIKMPEDEAAQIKQDEIDEAKQNELPESLR